MADAPEQIRSGDRSLEELGQDLVKAAYLQGDFLLSSGQRSSYYFDKYRFETRPGILRPLAIHLAGMIPDGVQRIAGPELGAVALATAVSLQTGLPFVIVKKGSKGYGTDNLFEGEIHAGEHVVVIEDILTTGFQAISAARKLESIGARVELIIGVVDRNEGARENVAAAGFQLRVLFTREDLGV